MIYAPRFRWSRQMKPVVDCARPMDLLGWLARMADYMPDASKHRTRFSGFYAGRAWASRRETDASGEGCHYRTRRGSSGLKCMSRS